MRIAVNRRALEINKRITDVSLHHPPIIIKDELGRVEHVYNLKLWPNKRWRIVYNPAEPWIEVMDDGEPMAFNVWIESYEDYD